MKAAETRLCVNGWGNFKAILAVWKLLVDMETAEYQNRFRSKKFRNLVITASMRVFLARTAGQIPFRYTLPNSSLILPVIKHRQFVPKPPPKECLWNGRCSMTSKFWLLVWNHAWLFFFQAIDNSIKRSLTELLFTLAWIIDIEPMGSFKFNPHVQTSFTAFDTEMGNNEFLV